MPNESSTIRALLEEADSRLYAGTHPERAGLDAATLLQFVLRQNGTSRDRAWLIAHRDEIVPAEVAQEFRAAVERRFAGEPIQYITGEVEFYGLRFQVNRDVLIPRPETELLVERVAGIALDFDRPRIADVGTGSGAIAVALAIHLSNAAICATDISTSALDAARANAARHSVAARVRFFQGDLLEPVASERFDIVVSNPPYVPERDRENLSVEVREYEPARALFAGTDGLDVIRRLIPAAFEALEPAGYVAFEIGHGQKEAVGTLLAQAGFERIDFIEDLQRIPRVAVASKPGRRIPALH
jgi:release factor glutamine methyltransferase